MCADDGARGLVAKDVVAFDDHGSDAACVPEVDVGTEGVLVWLGSMLSISGERGCF